jgi:hypothetical protein
MDRSCPWTGHVHHVVDKLHMKLVRYVADKLKTPGGGLEHCLAARWPHVSLREIGELPREVFSSRHSSLVNILFRTVTRNDYVYRHRFLRLTELDANRNETLLPAGCGGRINIHR